jgi:hypothetical protein
MTNLVADLNDGLLAIVALEKTFLEIMGFSWNLKIMTRWNKMK